MDNKIDLDKYKRKRRTFSKSGKDNRNQCEIISDKPTAIEYLVSYINNDDTKAYVTDLLQSKVPTYFWTNPSSSSGKYHSVDERSKFGLVLHTCRVVKIADDICVAAQISGEERDDIIVAAILHDGFKYGTGGSYHTVTNHPDIPGEELDISDTINALIRTHSGQWYNPEEWKTSNEYQRILHLADYIGSRSYIHVRIP